MEISTLDPKEMDDIEQAIRRMLLDINRPNAVRLKACIRILMTTSFTNFKDICSISAQEEIKDLVKLLQKPEILAPNSSQTPEGRNKIIDHIQTYTLGNLHLLDERNTILPNTDMVIKSVEGRERLKSVVHTTAIRNVISSAHYIDHIRKAFQEKGLKGTALDEAVNEASEAMVRLHDAIVAGDLATVKRELKVTGVDVNIPNLDGQVFLHIATREGNLEIVKELLSVPNINVNRFSNTGWTSLHLAARLGYAEIVNLLLQHPEIDINIVNSDGWTALHWAAWHGHDLVVKELLKAPNIKINPVDQYHSTPLHWAARNGQPDVILHLIQRPEILINQKDVDGKTPLYFAAMFGHEAAVEALLKSHEIDVNIPDMDGLTPLHWAARNGNLIMVKYLLAMPKIKKDILDNNEMTPADWAVKLGFDSIVPLLALPKKEEPFFLRIYHSIRDYIQKTWAIITAPNP